MADRRSLLFKDEERRIARSSAFLRMPSLPKPWRREAGRKLSVQDRMKNLTEEFWKSKRCQVEKATKFTPQIAPVLDADIYDDGSRG